MKTYLLSPATWRAAQCAMLMAKTGPYAELARATTLDRLADFEIQQGNHEAGERLSNLAQEIRAHALGVQP